MIDPVCGMTVDPARAAGSSQYKGQTFYFCSKGCVAKFEADPERYLAPDAPKEMHHAPAAVRRATPGPTMSARQVPARTCRPCRWSVVRCSSSGSLRRPHGDIKHLFDISGRVSQASDRNRTDVRRTRV